eukprot:scaffold14739_cov107-Isochrysis_galbana.AAC.8
MNSNDGQQQSKEYSTPSGNVLPTRSSPETVYAFDCTSSFFNLLLLGCICATRAQPSATLPGPGMYESILQRSSESLHAVGCFVAAPHAGGCAWGHADG